MAAYLFNGVTNYVAATGDSEYREAVLAVWDDFVDRRMYLHGGRNLSSKLKAIEGSILHIARGLLQRELQRLGNFQWAHSLARLTGEARYIDTADECYTTHSMLRCPFARQ